MKRQLDAVIRALWIINIAKKPSSINEEVELEEKKLDNHNFDQNSVGKKDEGISLTDSDEELEFEDDVVEVVDQTSIDSGRLSPLSLESLPNSTAKGSDVVYDIPDEPDDNDSSSSNKLEQLLDDLSPYLDQDSDPEPSLHHSPFRIKGETKYQ